MLFKTLIPFPNVAIMNKVGRVMAAASPNSYPGHEE